MTSHGVTDVFALVDQLLKERKEMPWLEFKGNFWDPNEIGQYLSALSNSAALDGRPFGYLIWGVNDSHDAVNGTSVSWEGKKGKGNEDIIPWLRRNLKPDLEFDVVLGERESVRIVVLVVPAAKHSPTSFLGRRYIRIDSYNKPLEEFPEREARLFAALRSFNFETQDAAQGWTFDKVLSSIDHGTMYRLFNDPLPTSREEIAEFLRRWNIARQADDGYWSVTNLGAILLARDLTLYPTLASKSVRLVKYDGKNKAASRTEIPIPTQGYATVFEGLITLLEGLIPRNEVILKDLRQELAMYPMIALREIIANALVHQDFTIVGSAPMIELFSDRLVVRNAGNPLVPPDRFLDQDRARNEKTVELMRRMRICEKSGSGIDKVAQAIESHQLPALDIKPGRSGSGSVEETVVTIFGHREYARMKSEERVNAAYWHAAFLFIQNERMSNSSLRERFGLQDSHSSAISAVIKKAIEEGRIKVEDETVGNKAMRYVPWWA